METHNTENIYVLNPDYLFKLDLDRICMYSKINIEHDSSLDWVSYIHPFQAIILYLFDGHCTLKTITEKVASHFKITYEAADKLIDGYIENPNPIHTEWQGEKVYFPKNVLISRDIIKGEYKVLLLPDLSELDWNSINVKNDRSHKAPHKILWMLTNTCVTDCAYCYADKRIVHKPMPIDKAIEIIDSAYDLGVINIDVIGGEVFMHKDWDILIKRMVEKGMSPSFLSTKIPITETILLKLKKTGYNNVIQISLDSLDKEIVHKTICGGSDYLKKITHGIRLLDEAGYKIQIDTILTKDTAVEANLWKMWVIRHFA